MSAFTGIPLHAETGSFDGEYLHRSTMDPSSPTNQRSQTMPTFMISPSPEPERSPPSLPNPNNRVLNEPRKLLALLFSRFQSRLMPPTIFDSFKTSSDSSVRGAARFKSGRLEGRTQSFVMNEDHEDDEDDEGKEDIFTTNATFDLMVELKEVLVICITQGWQIFNDDSSIDETSDSHESGGKLSSPFRRQSQHPMGKRPRSPGQSALRSAHAPELLSRCISILASVVSEDCRYKMSSPRPTRPPNALQALTLDIAQFLLHIQHHDPKVVSQIGFALIPAFTTFHPEMHTRLLTFFEQSIIRASLRDLRHLQGLDGVDISPSQTKDIQDSKNLRHVTSPVFSINIETIEGGRALPATDPNLHPRLHSSGVWGIPSSNAPLQPMSVYYLASLTSPLLAAMLEGIDFVSGPHSRPEVLHRFYSLLNTIVTTKADAYLNLLEVVAYHTGKARQAAVGLLVTYWPKVVGHVVVSKPLPIFSYSDSTGIGKNSLPLRDHPYAHQFVPWSFDRGSRADNLSLNDCRACLTSIHGFGLLCPFCMSAVHFDCYNYPEGSDVSRYATNNSDVQTIAAYRFCHVLQETRDSDPTMMRRQHHSFRLVNLFGLSLCFVCRKPLWGCTAQGLRCSSCSYLAHCSCIADTTLPSCASNTFDSNRVSVNWSVLRTSFAEYYRAILLSEEEVFKCTHEELSVLYAVLWMQLQLLNNGVALGTVVVRSNGGKTIGSKESGIDTFELQSHVHLYETHLLLGRLPLSPIIQEYIEESHLSPSKYSIMFDWSGLVYITTVIKSPFDIQSPRTSSPDLLNVPHPDKPTEFHSEHNTHPLAVVSLSHIRAILRYELSLFSDVAAHLFLSHLHHLGLFSRLDRNPILFEDETGHDEIYCNFPLPLGLDLSADVESLVAAVEACLSDVDLSVNEVGFLFLVRKLWPSGLASEYASRRLAMSVLSWIVAEDDSLALILREYLAKQQVLPGVRSNADPISWPSTHSSRAIPASSAKSGGDYISSRHTLLTRYGTRWLLALHNQDKTLYVSTIYECCTELAEDRTARPTSFPGLQSTESEKRWHIDRLDTVIRLVIKLSRTGIAFGVSDDLFVCWLNSLLKWDLCREHFPSLKRLFPRESVERSSSAPMDISFPHNDGSFSGSTLFDPWNVVIKLASENEKGLAHSLRWLCAFSRSGIDVPVSTFMLFSSLAIRFEAQLSDSIWLAEAALSSTWLRSLGRQELQVMLSALHSRLASHILHCLRTKENLPQVVRFIRQTLATCLLLHGCERDMLISAQMVSDEDIKGLPSRRSLTSRASAMPDPITLDPQLISALEIYVNVDVEDVTCLTAKFLNMFINDTPFLEPHEIDNFILRNGKALCACAWQLYDIERQDISSIRTTFLLRVLAIDSEPFQRILQNFCQTEAGWEPRLLAVTRLFRIILDVTSPNFNVEGRQWRSSILDVFYHYFSSIWADEREEIRLFADACSRTLLPSHFEAISLCWNESLAKSSVVERVKLVYFLIQLRPHFPSWKVLSWDGMIETLMVDDFGQRNISDKDNLVTSPRAASGSMLAPSLNADSNMVSLQVSIVLLSLQMITDGITIDTSSLLKIKLRLVQVIGFNDASLVLSPSGHAFHIRFSQLQRIPDLAVSCINEFPSLLDAHHPFDLASSAMGGPYADDDNSWPLLIGAIFVDVLLITFCAVEDILSLPDLTVKSMLESLMIIVYKHDLESRPLKHLQSYLRKAIRRILDLLLMETSYDLRQLALSVVQACTKRWAALMGTLVYDAVESVATLLSSQDHGSQDVLVTHAQSYIDTTITMFSGFFNALCKRPLDSDFFVVLKSVTDLNAKRTPPSSESLRDVLLRDTMARAAENDHSSFQLVLNNLQRYIEVVHHQGYSTDLMQYVGLCLTMIVRRASEWSAEVFDPTPLFVIPAILIQHNKTQSREFLAYTETVVRIALIRFIVKKTCLSRILGVTSSHHRKTRLQHDTPSTQPNNIITSALVEILADGLRMKTRIWPSTLTSILEAITTSDDNGLLVPAQTFQDTSLAHHAVFFLQNYIWTGTQSEADFTASTAVAKFLLEAFSRDHSLVSKLLLDHSWERGSRPSPNVRCWNILVWTALSNSVERWVSLLYVQLSAFALVHSNALRAHIQSPANLPTTGIADINHAYISLKLWVMLAHKQSFTGINSASEAEDAGNTAEIMVWNQLWPAFESLVNVFDVGADAENATLATLTWASVADLFLFLHQLRSPLALETSTQSALLIRLRGICYGETATNKLTRTLRAITESPSEISLESLVNETAKEIVAAEKLHALEIGKIVSDRKGSRITS